MRGDTAWNYMVYFLQGEYRDESDAQLLTKHIVKYMGNVSVRKVDRSGQLNLTFVPNPV